MLLQRAPSAYPNPNPNPNPNPIPNPNPNPNPNPTASRAITGQMEAAASAAPHRGLARGVTVGDETYKLVP